MSVKNVIVIAPHPDDETLGCGGTILKHVKAGDLVHWVIVTQMNPSKFTEEQRGKRSEEISLVGKRYGFKTITTMNFFAAELNSVNLGSLIGEMSQVFAKLNPEIVYAPFYGDAHTDHHWVFKAVVACIKSFRYPSVKKVLCYETISETEFGAFGAHIQFFPQVFNDVTEFFETKMDIMNIYASEMAPFPYPRSTKAIEALGRFRGSTAGVGIAESFQLVKEIL